MKAHYLGKQTFPNQIIKKKPTSFQPIHNNQIKSPISSFGPHMLGQKPFEIRKKVKKLIHYDCKENEDVNDEIPNEDEVYIKGSLLKKTDNPE